ncbi:hypothetical protein [Paenibacillus sp. FSL M7-1046]|uniref:hypothetical protein n=1 Tax=Paenibacillus sp. FSL M7-1046 TaxID=2975315 RepID=UPI0030F71894
MERKFGTGEALAFAFILGFLPLQAELYKLKNYLEAKAAEGKFGTVGAIATAFVYGFQPLRAV